MSLSIKFELDIINLNLKRVWDINNRPRLSFVLAVADWYENALITSFFHT